MKQPSLAAPTIFVLALLLPAAYVGTYLAIFDPAAPLAMQADGHCERQHYRYGGELAKFVFEPLRLLDWRN